VAEHNILQYNTDRNSLQASPDKICRLYLNIVKVKYNEDTIETFIRENKDKFGVYHPSDSHLDKFMLKIRYRISHIISIVPYLSRVAIATAIIFTASIITWNNYIRKDRHEITLGNKISLVINKITTK
jgi:hypothetical protein